VYSGGAEWAGPLLPKKVLSEKKKLSGKKIKIKIKIKKPYSTGYSLVVPYRSTEPAQRCLTSQFGWDAVLSPWYDRMTKAV
jgi:hypothetical protein